MLLIYTQRITPRITYVFKHICTRILGMEVSFTSVIEEFISYEGPKFSYGKQQMGNELFIQSNGFLIEQGIESVSFKVSMWDDTKCFFSVSKKSALPFDIFSASFYLLSRYEEYLPHRKDPMGRYPASESLSYKEDFLHLPVVDIWAYKFKNIISREFPNINFPNKRLNKHTLVQIKEPFAYLQKGFFRSVIGYLRDLGKLRIRNVIRRTRVLLGLIEDPFNTFDWIIEASKKSQYDLSLFFLLGEATTFRESHNTNRRKFRELIKRVADYCDVGLMYSNVSLGNFQDLKREKSRLEEITHRVTLHTMNINYQVILPDIYRNLVELEVAKDFTMGYEDIIGFRAGTCTPFLFYDLDYEIRTPLVIQPIAMSTKAFEDKYASDIKKTISQIIENVKIVNGTFSMVFSNRDFINRKNRKIWRTIYLENLS